MNNKLDKILAEISAGELIDKITILEIKRVKISNKDKLIDIEKELFLVRPGITDFSSIVFSDEGDILKRKDNPDLVYNQIIRPWKSRLGLIYIKNQSLLLDIKIIIYTIIGFASKQRALNWVSNQLGLVKADLKVINM